MSAKPTGVLILAILQLIIAILWLALGALLLMAGTGTLLDIILMFLAVFPIVLGVIGLILFYGLYTLKGWAWLWALIINILGILSGLMGSLTDIVNLLSLGLSVVIVLYLLMPATRAYFK
ncbi:MAG: hypothetical protein JSW61_13005 [Candidatus Thorarchaeota archaeon]|nr:MAG: hypothetical protein JSW61_13005 [Candidatus Thorarchaeota archaeon]